MAHPLDNVVQHIRRVAANQGATDGELLQSFVTSNDQTAFASLVKRHGKLVLAVCMRKLGNLEDAEDAFQATFVILARKAATLPQTGSLASWLHNVAYRIAISARRLAARRSRHERKAKTMVSANPASDATWREVQLLLDEEIQRLPERFREPFILCCLESQSYAAAAQQMGVKESTVHGRLTEARRRLQSRLSRRGVELTAVLGAVALAPSAATAQVPSALVAKAVSAATSAAVPASVTALVKGVTASLAIKKAKVGVAMFFAFSALVGTTSMWAFQQQPGGQEKAPRAQVAGKQEATVKAEPAVAKDIYGDPLPAGALARMGSIRMRHAGLSGFVILADGKNALTAGGDGVLRFWDLGTGEQKRTVKLDGVGPGRWLALAPNGKTVAAMDKGKIVFLEVDSGRQIKTVPAPKGGVDSLCFSPDGQTLAVGRRDWEFTLLEWTTEKERQVKLPVFMPDNIQFSMDSSFHGSFSPDGKWFVAGASLNQPLGIFDFSTGREVHRLNCHAFTSTVSPDSKRLAVSSYKNDRGDRETVIRLFDLASGKEIAQFPQGKINGFFSLAFAPDGNTLACGFSDNSCLLDLRTGKVVYRLPGRPLEPAFLPDGKTLLTSDGHSLHCWDAATGKELQPRPGEFGYEPVLAISPDGRRLAAGEWMNQNVDIWNPATSRQVDSLPLKGEQRYVRNLAFTRDGQTLISAQGMGLLQYWSTGTGKEQRTLQLRDSNKSNQDIIYFYQLHACAGGKHIATLDRVFTRPPGDVPSKEITRLAQWDAGTGKLLREHTLPANTRVCAWLADGACVAFPETDGLTMMEVESGRSRWHVAGTASAGPLAASPDDRLLAALQGGSSGTAFTVGIWEVATGKEITTVKTGRVWRLALAPDNRSLVTTGDGILRLWDLATGKERGHWALPVGAWRLLLWPDGRRAFTALADGSALVWDLTSGLQATDLLVKDAGPKEMATWWEDMSGDADRAYAAVWRLAEVKEEVAVSFLRKNLKPIGETDLQKIQMGVNDLGSESFKVREQARQELESLGSAAVPPMRLALETSLSLEVRRRLESLLSRPFRHTPKTLRHLRAIQVLERIATKDARRLLTEIANGVAYASETQEAKASLERLAQRALGMPP